MVESLGPYRILDAVGTWGVGAVYRARDTRHGRTVALTVVDPAIAGDEGRRERLLADARSAATLSHPNVATLFDIGEDQGQIYLAIEYVPGETLRTVIGGRPLNPRRAIDLAVQMADALADAHAAGLVHGDLRPEAIVVNPKGHAKILEFGFSAWTRSGIARSRAATMSDAEIVAGAVPVAYLSPEQALGSVIDYRSDIFSLGVILFEMLTGHPPYTAAKPSDVPLQILHASVKPPSTTTTDLPKEIDPVLGRALARNLDDRYEAAATMAAELRAVGAILETRAEADTVEFQPPAPPRRTGRWVLVLFVLGALAALGWIERGSLARIVDALSAGGQ